MHATRFTTRSYALVCTCPVNIKTFIYTCYGVLFNSTSNKCHGLFFLFRFMRFHPPVIQSVQLPTHFFVSPILNASFRIISSSRMVRFTEHGGSVGKNTNLYRILVGKLELKKRLGRPMFRRENIIKTDPKLIILVSVKCINFGQDRNRCGTL